MTQANVVMLAKIQAILSIFLIGGGGGGGRGVVVVVVVVIG